MKISEQLSTFLRAARRAFRKNSPAPEQFPTQIVDLVIFHKLHFFLAPAEAWKCYRQLQSEFVDWNEVRISSVLEIQEQLSPATDSLEVAVFIKDFLEFVHNQRQRVSLEPIVEENLTEFRRYFKQIKGIETATVDLLLLLRKEHPVVPLSPAMVQALSRLGVVRASDSLDRKQKKLYERVGADDVLAFHFHLLDLSRGTDPADGRKLDAAFGRKPSARRVGARRATKKTGKRAVSRGAAAASKNGKGPANARRRVVARPVAGKRVRKTKKARR